KLPAKAQWRSPYGPPPIVAELYNKWPRPPSSKKEPGNLPESDRPGKARGWEVGGILYRPALPLLRAPRAAGQTPVGRQPVVLSVLLLCPGMEDSRHVRRAHPKGSPECRVGVMA